MNKRVLIPIVTGCVFVTIFAAGCAAHKRTKPASIAPSIISTSATTRPVITETKVVTVFKEAPTEATTTTTEATTTTTTSKPTATPKPTAKPTAKPTKKPTAKPTKKPTAKPAVKNTTTAAVKANTLSAVPKADATQITGIYRGAWSEMTVDGTNVNNVKLTVIIHDQEDDSKASVWKMNGNYNPETGTMVYTNCSKTNYTYDVNNSIAAKNTAYENGKGKIVIRDGMVTWYDYQEHVADDMTFVSAKNHDHG